MGTPSTKPDTSVKKQAVYLTLAINLEGHKELLGMWVAENEGAKFRMKCTWCETRCGT